QGPQVYTFTIIATDGGNLQSTVNVQITVAEPLLVVLDETALTPSGAVIRFNRSFNTAFLSLYSTENGAEGLPDVELVGPSGPVIGSLVVTASSEITFIKTGGVLDPGTYTLRVRSGPKGMSRTDGTVLDGNKDGVPGDDFVRTLTLSGTSSV